MRKKPLIERKNADRIHCYEEAGKLHITGE